ncbi:hypothetical protein F4779DRAFT_366793 [Xylariaceae sp. FL0662B]|nr:hypothetical protein F4779DRAFT_366793 [Xylariaceae sp. FL0662B]
MPIGDLLAEISGGKSSPAPPTKTPTSSGVKRKAEDDSNNATSAKVIKSRQQDGPYSANKTTRNPQGDTVERSYLESRPAAVKSSSLPHRTSSPSTNGRPYQPPAPNGLRTTTSFSNGRPTPTSLSNSSLSKQSSDPTSRPKLNSAPLTASKVPPAKPSPTTPTPTDPSKAPKKGSFAEIMARGAKAQQTMGKVGMIQHKPIDRPMAKKERDAGKSEQKHGIKGQQGKSYLGNGRSHAAPSRDAARSGTTLRDVSRGGPTKITKAGGKQKVDSSGGETQEKKVKKSAIATTGYTGTARPRPGPTSSKPPTSKNGKRPGAAGGLLAPPKPSRPKRYDDEYDEDLDDFIDYDDEEEPDPRGYGYGYGSDASSDMEAGVSDIDVEERRAELLAREEDKREQALEEKLKQEKEQRKRRLMQGR